jgi:hypothetical protein
VPVRSHLRPRSPLTRRPHWLLLALLAITVVYGSVATWKRSHRPGGRWVGRTDCAWLGEPVMTIRPGLARSESIATVAHEAVHVEECRALGPVRYRWNTLFASSNLRLEAPAYCAAGRVRLRLGWSPALVRETIVDDMLAAMADGVDSVTIAAALRETCPDVVATAR